jgi:hypothetical protein
MQKCKSTIEEIMIKRILDDAKLINQEEYNTALDLLYKNQELKIS